MQRSSFLFSKEFAPHLYVAEAFQGKLELMVDDISDEIQYISWQNCK